MPRYVFHVYDGVQHIDREGVELSGPEKARSHAVLAAGELLKAVDSHFTNGNWSTRVLDEDGSIVSDIMIVVRRKKPQA